MTDRLMPCPFCGREQHNPLEAGHADDCYFTLHDKLKREMEESNCYSVPDVLAAWNRRAIPEKRPLAQAPAVGAEVAELVRQSRELCAATLRAGPGVAVEIPAKLAEEGRKFMRGEPSLIEQMPFADVQKLGDLLGESDVPVQHMAPAQLLAGTPHHEGGGGDAVEDWSGKTSAANSSPTPTGGEGRGVEVSGLAAEGSQDAGATAEMPRARKFDSSGLTAEGYEASAASVTAGDQLDDALVPEPAEGHFNRMLQHLGRNPA